MPPWLQSLLNNPPPLFDDGGAGVHNATILTTAGVRPAFFDVSCLMYRLIYAKADEYAKFTDEQIPHLLAVDTLRDITDACRNFACAPVLTFDSKYSLRKQEFDGYKAGRGGQRKTVEQERVLGHKNEGLLLLRTVYCPSYRVQTYLSHGYESDDIIAGFVLGLKQRGFMENAAFDGYVVVVSSDHDLHQLLLDGVYWADVTQGVLCTGNDVERHTGIAVADVVASKVIGGCKSDAVPGIPGCGEKTVEQVLSGRTVDVRLKRARDAMLSDEGARIAERNLRLVRLPYDGYQPQRLCRDIWPRVGVPDDAGALLDSLGIAWERWPSFGDVTAPRPVGSIPMCAWKGGGE